MSDSSNHSHFTPWGAVFFFGFLIVSFALIWFAFYGLMLSRH